MSDGLISLDARNIAGTWWIGKLGRAVASSEVDCITALKSAVRNADRSRPVGISWSSPPDTRTYLKIAYWYRSFINVG
jgi:hypothetical protein